MKARSNRLAPNPLPLPLPFPPLLQMYGGHATVGSEDATGLVGTAGLGTGTLGEGCGVAGTVEFVGAFVGVPSAGAGLTGAKVAGADVPLVTLEGDSVGAFVVFPPPTAGQ